MRQVFSIFLMFLVLTGTVGIAATKHFCGEDLSHISLEENVKNCCGDEKEDMPSDCCHDESELFVLDHVQLDQHTVQLQPLTLFTINLLAHFLTSYHTEAAQTSPLWTAFHSPPHPNTDVYIWVQSFLI